MNTKEAKYKVVQSQTGYMVSGKSNHFLGYSGYLQVDYIRLLCHGAISPQGERKSENPRLPVPLCHFSWIGTRENPFSKLYFSDHLELI